MRNPDSSELFYDFLSSVPIFNVLSKIPHFLAQKLAQLCALTHQMLSFCSFMKDLSALTKAPLFPKIRENTFKSSNEVLVTMSFSCHFYWFFILLDGSTRNLFPTLYLRKQFAAFFYLLLQKPQCIMVTFNIHSQL